MTSANLEKGNEHDSGGPERQWGPESTFSGPHSQAGLKARGGSHRLLGQVWEQRQALVGSSGPAGASEDLAGARLLG